jgi:hypothetical protein
VFMRSLALSCVLLYVIIGFVAGACPSLPDEPSRTQSAHHRHHHPPNKPAVHALACAWACHVSANQAAIDLPSQLVPVWFVATWLIFPEVRMRLTRHLFIFARPPPSFFA